MDRTDKQILDNLQHNSQISNQELADQVALSPSPCLRRVKQLEQAGYIERYVALLNPEKLGLQLTVIVSVGLESHAAKVMQHFEKAMKKLPEVTQCYLIAGQAADYLLQVIVPNLNEFQHFLLNKLTRLDGVSNVQSSFVLRPIIKETAMPLEHL